MTEPEEFTSLKGATIPRKISVDYISFSAHVDYSQNSDFIEQVKAQHVVRSRVNLPSFPSFVLLPMPRFSFMENKTPWDDYEPQ
jgi:hypothetical protein